jgi:hypothetical protein
VRLCFPSDTAHLSVTLPQNSLRTSKVCLRSYNPAGVAHNSGHLSAASLSPHSQRSPSGLTCIPGHHLSHCSSQRAGWLVSLSLRPSLTTYTKPAPYTLYLLSHHTHSPTPSHVKRSLLHLHTEKHHDLTLRCTYPGCAFGWRSRRAT